MGHRHAWALGAFVIFLVLGMLMWGVASTAHIASSNRQTVQTIRRGQRCILDQLLEHRVANQQEHDAANEATGAHVSIPADIAPPTPEQARLLQQRLATDCAGLVPADLLAPSPTTTTTRP